MQVFDATHHISDFIRFSASHKKNINENMFLHVSITNPQNKPQFLEIEQLLQFHLNIKGASLLKIPQKNSFLIFASKEANLKISTFEKMLYEHFEKNSLQAFHRPLDATGLEHFSSILKPLIPHSDTALNIAYSRLKRPSNTILVLDDDPMVLKNMDKILSNYGNVITLETPDNFEENYELYAPNALFLDVHLRTEKGSQILKKLKKETDPNAHVVMISSDTNQALILDVKNSGAAGFVVKPFKREKVFQELMRAPTITLRSSVK